MNHTHHYHLVGTATAMSQAAVAEPTAPVSPAESTHENLTLEDGLQMAMTDLVGHKNYFHTEYIQLILFSHLRTLSVEALVAACVVVFSVAILYEGIPFVRKLISLKNIMVVPQSGVELTHMHVKGNADNGQTPSREQLKVTEPSLVVVSRPSMLTRGHFLQTSVHMVRLATSYLLMLVVMTFNVWLGLAVITGAAVGYFVFGWKRRVIVTV